MTSGEGNQVAGSSTTGARWFVAGSVLSLLSALALAWSGTVCVDVLKILIARDLSGLEALGQRLGRVCWSPLGVAVGTTLIAAGFRRTVLRGRLSQRSLVLVALYGIVAAYGAFFVFQGTSSARATMAAIVSSDRAIKPEEFLAAITQAVTPVSRGWVLLAVAQVLLSIGGLMQYADQSKSSGSPHHWPKSATMSMSLLWVFGSVASIAWLRRGWEILELRGSGPVKASIIVEMLNGVLSFSWFASLFLFGHAVLATIVAVATYRTLARSRAT